MTRIALVVSDVDGTLVTHEKVLTDAAKGAVRRLRDAGIGFTIVSSRPTLGMRFLIEPLEITLPVGSFNGSSIVDPQLKPIEQHLIPAATAQTSLDVLNEFGVDIWLFTNDLWLTRNGDGAYVPNEIRAIRANPTSSRFLALSDGRLQDRRRQRRRGAAATLRSRRCRKPWAGRPPRSDRRATISTSPRRATTRAPSSKTMAGRLGISTDAVATIGDMQNDLPMFAKSGLSVAMGNATDDVKQTRDARHDDQRE